jgi:hypothetical protein
MRRIQSSAAVAALAALAALAVVPAAHANFIATVEDAAGDATQPDPGRDLAALTVDYDRRTGSLTGAVALHGTPDPDAPSFITLATAKRTAAGCDGYPAGVFGSYTDEWGASWLRLDTAGATPAERGEADKRGFSGAVQSFSAETPALVGQPFECVLAILSEPGNAANVFDTAGPVDLVGQPALAMRVTTPERFKPNRAKRMRIRLENTGDAPTGTLQVRLSRARGVKTTPRRRALRPLAPGARKTIRIKLRLSGRARDVTDLEIKVGDGRLAGRETVPLRLRRPRKGGGGSNPGGNAPSRVCTRWSPDLFGGTGGSLILVPC